jgi:SAM-dependent methyltransferase
MHAAGSIKMDMNTEIEIKQQVREFYDQVGWQVVGEGLYQNARYEDLRPVAREYIQRCHARVSQHLSPTGKLFLDAGSGPIQYPAYLEYSRGYQYRVCADISIIALREARARIGDHGIFVVADVAHLPFKADAFDGVISLHTIHHLPQEEHLQAYAGLLRVLRPSASGVVVNGWKNSTFTRLTDPLIGLLNKLLAFRRGRQKAPLTAKPPQAIGRGKTSRRGTFVDKQDAAWLKHQVGTRIPLEIRVWRSLNVRALRAFIHERWGGRRLLGFVYSLEERFPHFFGEHGAYPLIVIRKPA